MKIVKKDANDQNVSNIKQMHAMCIHSFGARYTNLIIFHSILVLVGFRGRMGNRIQNLISGKVVVPVYSQKKGISKGFRTRKDLE